MNQSPMTYQSPNTAASKTKTTKVGRQIHIPISYGNSTEIEMYKPRPSSSKSSPIEMEFVDAYDIMYSEDTHLSNFRCFDCGHIVSGLFEGMNIHSGRLNAVAETRIYCGSCGSRYNVVTHHDPHDPCPKHHLFKKVGDETTNAEHQKQVYEIFYKKRDKYISKFVNNTRFFSENKKWNPNTWSGFHHVIRSKDMDEQDIELGAEVDAYLLTKAPHGSISCVFPVNIVDKITNDKRTYTFHDMPSIIEHLSVLKQMCSDAHGNCNDEILGNYIDVVTSG